MDEGTPARRATVVAAAVIVAAAMAAYANSLAVPYLFDDAWSIAENPTIRRLWSWSVLRPPPAVTVGGRPVANVSFAVSYALHGLDVGGYHAGNIAVHALAGLVLLGLLRRVFETPALAPGFGGAASSLAFASALLFTLHPLQTESVTYVVQRTEALAGLFYFLTLYAFLRSTTAARPRRWEVAAVLASLLGMGSKEIMASAPLITLLIDRTLVAGSFREAWARRGGLHLALHATLGLLAVLVLTTGDRGETAGFAMGIPWWAYALKQCEAIVHYLGLSVWPSPLVFDYGTAIITDPREVAAEIVVLAVLLGATAVAVVRRHPAGLAGAMFFAVLAPSSSVVPVASQTMNEHRMYTALAPVLALVLAVSYRVAGRRAIVAGVVVAVAFGVLTVRRNRDYRDAITLWTDTARKLPANHRAHSNAGVALFEAGRAAEALPYYEAALRRQPEMPAYLLNLGNALFQLGRAGDALDQYDAALRLDATLVQAHYNRGNVLGHEGHLEEAVAAFEAALRLDPQHADSRVSMALALRTLGRLDDARGQLEEALRLRPDLAAAHQEMAQVSFDLGGQLAAAGRLDEARQRYEDALRLRPESDIAHNNLAGVLLRLGRVEEALAHCEEAVRLNPGNRQAAENAELLRARLASGRP